MYLLNGESKHCVDVSDRGFQYGDGLFETIEILNGKPLFLSSHLDRLLAGCERLLIPPPDRKILTQEARRMSSEVDHAVLKLMVTRGSGGRGYRQPAAIHPTRLFSRHPYPQYPETLQNQGVAVRFCRNRLGLNPTLAGIKHMNRLEQILARAEWRDDDIQEGLMLSHEGYVIEGTMSNVFYVKDQRLISAPVERCGVAGIVRSLIFNLADQHAIEARQDYFLPEQLLQADEIFLTNSIIGIWPVNKLEQQAFTIGPLTKKLQTAYQQLKQREAQHD
ncbi:aminodeoxychorismate lyase [Methylomarinum sp. Ch1-1]|uniref:Aminodeoxychorismate lyase n=1 Tax=Methylomarinum roseum TaxID=3067653 RepID=A0AAU7NSW8_9GAMM|nr:aminodeoxychorismate lyase [Methylomarinum sp. Ch1-1]MDP4519956.1 aminodeoxychorismate lyase [Methylomarinum sp. Ch1-1]